MRQTFAIAAAILCTLIAPERQAVAGSGDAALPTIPPIPYRERVLENGLRVYTVRTTATPNVAVQLWYRVGGRDDPKGRSGFAHLFEHLLFKSTRNMPAEMLDRLTEDVGGYNNATTWDDRTAYTDVVPANHLERVLWAEADRLKTLVIDEANFASERDVVKEEYRQSVLADPFGRLFFRLLPQLAFATDPHRLGVIGDLADLDAATIEDARSFHATYYRPDNAVLVVAGNFDQSELDRWVDRNFGQIAKPDRTIPRPGEPDPAPDAPRSVTAYAPNLPYPVVMTLQRTVGLNHPDAAALRVMNAILVSGRSSRLYESLVVDQRLGSELFTTFDRFAAAGFATYGIAPSGGVSLEAAESAIAGELARIRDEPVTPDELAEAKTEILVGTARSRETVQGLSEALAEAALIAGNAAEADAELAAIRAVTAADVARVARTYLAEANATRIRYLPEEDRPAGATAMDITSSPSSSAKPLIPVQTPVFALLPEAEREKPPAPGEARPLQVPAPSERVLANGLRVVVARVGVQPLATVRLSVRTGSCADAPDRAGTASLLSSLLTESAGSRSAAELAETVEGFGGDLASGVTLDSMWVQMNAPDSNLESAAGVLADVVRRPGLAEIDFERQRARAIDNYRNQLSSAEGAATLAASALLFGAGPCGQPVSGSERTLAAVTHADMRAFYERAFRPDDAVLVITGRITEAEGFALAEKLFGDWPRPSTARSADPVPNPDDGIAKIVIIDRKGAGQTSVMAVHRLPPASDRNLLSIQLANSVLGGGFSARLAREIRIKRGLAYNADSEVELGRGAGILIASSQTKDATGGEVADLTLKEMGKLATDAAAPAELEARKAALIGQFGSQVETTASLAALLGGLAVSDVPLRAYADYIQDVQALEAADVQRVAKASFSPETADLIMVGDASVVVPALGAMSGIEVIPVRQFDPTMPDLRSPRDAVP